MGSRRCPTLTGKSCSAPWEPQSGSPGPSQPRISVVWFELQNDTFIDWYSVWSLRVGQSVTPAWFLGDFCVLKRQEPRNSGCGSAELFCWLGGTWVPPKLEAPAFSQSQKAQNLVEVRIFRVSILSIWLSKVGNLRDLGPVAWRTPRLGANSEAMCSKTVFFPWFWQVARH